MDFSKAFGASFREVVDGEREGMPTHIVRMSRTYPTNPSDLWSALTEKDRIKRWFAVVNGDFKLGGRFSIEGNAEGSITVCDPPHALRVTWEYGGSTSWVAVHLKADNQGTLLTLEHENPTDEASEAHWVKYGPGATGLGWELALMGLEMHFLYPDEEICEAGMAWAGGEEAKAVMIQWANAWGEAHIKSGAPAEAAHQTTQRIVAFYTGGS
ncbi:MAG: SRPBCC family protein [Acidobacteria bacterium]|nr:SRPBCC family protein [Acidobacteriota bacterium]